MTRNKPVALLLAALLFGACSSPVTDGNAPKKTLVIGGADASQFTEEYYQMPTPNELFQLVRTLSDQGQRQMMSPANNVNRYVSTSKKALNFGVYATDLVYASSYGIVSEVARYYLNCKKLGDELGLTEAFSSQGFTRLERNLVKGDSLDVISNEAYERAYRQMQDAEMGPMLALVLVGGWVESMHLVAWQVMAYDADNLLVQRIAEQQAALDQLIDMTGQYADDPDVAQVREKLIQLRGIYDGFPLTRTEPEPSPSGRQVLGDDVTIFIDSDGFAELMAELDAIREFIIHPEDLVDADNS